MLWTSVWGGELLIWKSQINSFWRATQVLASFYSYSLYLYDTGQKYSTQKSKKSRKVNMKDEMRTHRAKSPKTQMPSWAAKRSLCVALFIWRWATCVLFVFVVKHWQNHDKKYQLTINFKGWSRGKPAPLLLLHLHKQSTWSIISIS